MSSNSSAGSSKLTNNCETCEKIKSDHQLDKICSQSYSSDYEEETPSLTQSENDKTTPESLGSMRLSLNTNNRLERDRNSSRSRKPQQNKTFSSEKIRDIERRNAMLVDKILYHNRRPNQYKTTAVYVPKITSSEINRRRHQEKISRENEVSCRS